MKEGAYVEKEVINSDFYFTSDFTKTDQAQK